MPHSFLPFHSWALARLPYRTPPKGSTVELQRGLRHLLTHSRSAPAAWQLVVILPCLAIYPLKGHGQTATLSKTTLSFGNKVVGTTSLAHKVVLTNMQDFGRPLRAVTPLGCSELGPRTVRSEPPHDGLGSGIDQQHHHAHRHCCHAFGCRNAGQLLS